MKKSGDEKIRYERVYNELCNSKGCWIGSGSKWATIPTLPHGFHGIFVSGGAKIGKRCVIYQNVTIGSNTTKGSSKNGSPEIGDNVLIGAGATIIGKIRIGNNVRIGAGCAVAIDVPDDSVVVSQKPVIIHKENMDNRFYHYENGKYGYVEDGIFHPVDGE
ncbi:MAG: serine acetyltransferase [Alphaproteobacteria bacterium]|nr:serine acetyltransferase [Alphaproteobacteria bacterium]